MDWTSLLAIGLFALAWLILIYQSLNEDWGVSQTVGMLVFLGGATGGVFLDDLLSAESTLLPWTEPIAAVVMLVGIYITTWNPGEDTRSV